MFGYSITRPLHNQDYYYGIFDACEQFRCDIEGWHTESGPGVFEAVSGSLVANPNGCDDGLYMTFVHGALTLGLATGTPIWRGQGNGR
jgi:hypothetical protein